MKNKQEDIKKKTTLKHVMEQESKLKQNRFKREKTRKQKSEGRGGVRHKTSA